jgi:hypothetical protein
MSTGRGGANWSLQFLPESNEGNQESEDVENNKECAKLPPPHNTHVHASCFGYEFGLDSCVEFDISSHRGAF